MNCRMLTLLLVCALLLAMTGCSAAGAEQTLERAGSRVENGLDAVEDTVENAVRRSVDPAPASDDSTVTKAQAENIALNHAGFTADQVQRLHTEYEIDNGVPQYDVEFHKDGVEYEFEIHAQTGEILSYDRDQEND